MSKQKQDDASGYISPQQWDTPKFLIQVGPWKTVSEHMETNGDDLPYMNNMAESYKDDSMGHIFPYAQADAAWSFTEGMEPVGLAPIIVCTGTISYEMQWLQVFKIVLEESEHFGKCYIHWGDAAEEDHLVKLADAKVPGKTKDVPKEET